MSPVLPLIGRLLSPLQTVFDLVLPPRCIGSGEIVAATGTLSAPFWNSLVFVAPPFCDLCGTPFSLDLPAGSLCASCIEVEPAFDRARAAVIYNDSSRQAILDFKYGDKLHAVRTFTPWLQRAGEGLLAETDLIVPVPLHWRRLFSRRFNQAGLLAKALAAASGKPYAPDILLRRRYTRPQKGLSRAERQENIRNAFAINPKKGNDLAHKTIMIVDDVFTSGATLNECARILKKAGAARVLILTVARVTRDHFSEVTL